MSLERFELNRAGVRELLHSEEMGQLLTEIAETVAGRAGDGYEAAAPHDSGQRLIVNVYPATEKAWRDNLENNTLLTALGG